MAYTPALHVGLSPASPLAICAYLVCLGHVLGHASPNVVRHIRYISQEALCHAEQCLMRPAVEPVKLCAVDQGRELAGPDTELVADRAEAEHHMQVAPDLQQGVATVRESFANMCDFSQRWIKYPMLVSIGSNHNLITANNVLDSFLLLPC